VVTDPIALALERLRDRETAPVATVPGYTPQPKQARAEELAGQAFELLYGGAAGGGKSYWIRNSAASYCLAHPGAHVAIVRRTLPMLKQTHLGPLTQALGGLARHNRTELLWAFPNGSVLRLISLQHDGDEQQYKSVEFDRLYFDELTELTEGQYTYMLSRLRSSWTRPCRECGTTAGHRVSAIAASNPEGRGFAWVKRRWVKPRPEDLAPGQGTPEPGVVWHPPLPDRSGPGPSRVFLPATLLDNPALLEANPEYATQLKALPDARKRRALLEGDWDAMDQVPGALWSLSTIDHVASHPDLARVVVGYDPATSFTESSDETGLIAVGSDSRRPPHVYVIGDASGRYQGPAEAAAACVRLAAAVQADVIVYETNQGGRFVELALRQAFKAAQAAGEWTGPLPRIVGVHAKRGKALRAEPVATMYGQGRVHHVGEWADLEAQMTTWAPGDPASPDRLDALVYAVTHVAGTPARFTGHVPTRDLLTGRVA
jgi:hypothetical protein